MGDDLKFLASEIQQGLDLQSACQSKELQGDAIWAEQVAARFRLWSDTSRVHLDRSASLSHKLRLHKVGYQVVWNLLSALHANIWFLCNLLGLHTGDDDESDSSSTGAEDDHIYGDADGNVESARSRIEDDLGMLVSYTSLINRTSRQANESKADEFNPKAAPDDDDDGEPLQLSMQFTSYTQATLKRIMGPENWLQLQKERPLFTSRLVQSIATRWRRLSYRLTRSAKRRASNHVHSSTVVSPIIKNFVPESTLGTQSATADVQRALTTGGNTTLSDVHSGGSTLRPEAVLSRPEKPAMSARTATVALTRALAYPPCPEIRRLNHTEVEFQCRYCDDYRAEAGKIGSEMKTWQNHLMKDLIPYICTYENCVDSLRMYSTIEEWSRHYEISHIELVWVCHQCPAGDTSRRTYTQEKAYTDHMQLAHGLTGSEILVSPQPQTFITCHLCGSTADDMQSGLDLTAAQLHRSAQACMAQHLKEYALISLPWHFEDRNRTGSNRAEHQSEANDEATSEMVMSGPALHAEHVGSYHGTAEDVKLFDLIRQSAPEEELPFDKAVRWMVQDVADSSESDSERGSTQEAVVIGSNNRHTERNPAWSDLPGVTFLACDENEIDQVMEDAPESVVQSPYGSNDRPSVQSAMDLSDQYSPAARTFSLEGGCSADSTGGTDVPGFSVEAAEKYYPDFPPMSEMDTSTIGLAEGLTGPFPRDESIIPNAMMADGPWPGLRHYLSLWTGQNRFPGDDEINSLALLEGLEPATVRAWLVATFQPTPVDTSSSSQEPQETPQETSQSTSQRISPSARHGSTQAAFQGIPPGSVQDPSYVPWNVFQDVARYASSRNKSRCGDSAMPMPAFPNQRYKCPNCSFTTQKFDSFKRHMLLKYPQDFWHCVPCRQEGMRGFIVSRSDKIARHVRDAHKLSSEEAKIAVQESKVDYVAYHPTTCPYRHGAQQCAQPLDSLGCYILHLKDHCQDRIAGGPWELPGRSDADNQHQAST